MKHFWNALLPVRASGAFGFGFSAGAGGFDVQPAINNAKMTTTIFRMRCSLDLSVKYGFREIIVTKLCALN